MFEQPIYLYISDCLITYLLVYLPVRNVLHILRSSDLRLFKLVSFYQVSCSSVFPTFIKNLQNIYLHHLFE